MTIGVTDNMGTELKWQLYSDWISRGSRKVKVQRLSYLLDNANNVRDLQGLLLTGGGDVDPVLWGSQTTSKTIQHVDRKRDEFERKAIDNALSAGIPILGICRGMQIANVHLGGTLHADLEEAGFPPHRNVNGGDQFHQVRVEPHSFLAGMTGSGEGTVNSFHHQAVHDVAKGLRPTAISFDGVIESLERETPDNGSFFLLVQWHPERMSDFESPFSRGILEQFLNSISTNAVQTKES